jgi:hypothetical protein
VTARSAQSKALHVWYAAPASIVIKWLAEEPKTENDSARFSIAAPDYLRRSGVFADSEKDLFE